MQLEINITVHAENASEGESQPLPPVWVGPSALNHVLFDFNPTSDNRVATIKGLCAAVIRLMMEQAQNAEAGGQPNDVAKIRTARIAITQMEIAQMCAVKALFAK